MNIIIDPHAGPCPGVKRAIQMVEDALHERDTLTAVGPLIHNKDEVARLTVLGLHTAEQEMIESNDLAGIEHGTVFIRSHGISSALEQKIVACNPDVIDATCGVVKNIQKEIRQKHNQGFQIIIVGKPGHPEVKGLNGYCDDQAVIIKDENDLEKIDLTQKSFLVSQTTIAQQKFLKLAEKIKSLHPQVIVKDTTCRQVTRRHENMRKFAASVDMLLLVGGKTSSNTAALFEIASQQNPHTHWVENSSDIKKEWFSGHITIGITGSASTPVWQLENLAQTIEKM